MSASIFSRKFELPKLNWWLWLGISVPVGIYLFCMPRGYYYDEEFSDWDYLLDWVRHYQLDREFWYDAFRAIIFSFGIALTLGLIMQYCITSIWHLVKRKGV